MNHGVAIGAHDDEVGETGCLRLCGLRKGEQVMHLRVAHTQFAVDVRKVEVAARDRTNETAVLAQCISDLPLAKRTFTPAVDDQAVQSFALQANQFLGADVDVGVQSGVPPVKGPAPE